MLSDKEQAIYDALGFAVTVMGRALSTIQSVEEVENILRQVERVQLEGHVCANKHSCEIDLIYGYLKGVLQDVQEQTKNNAEVH